MPVRDHRSGRKELTCGRFLDREKWPVHTPTRTLCLESIWALWSWVELLLERENASRVQKSSYSISLWDDGTTRLQQSAAVQDDTQSCKLWQKTCYFARRNMTHIWIAPRYCPDCPSGDADHRSCLFTTPLIWKWRSQNCRISCSRYTVSITMFLDLFALSHWHRSSPVPKNTWCWVHSPLNSRNFQASHDFLARWISSSGSQASLYNSSSRYELSAVITLYDHTQNITAR